jgi:hypothetical protein
MSDTFDDLKDFLERRLTDRENRDDSPDREILDALIELTQAGCPPPTISVRWP